MVRQLLPPARKEVEGWFTAVLAGTRTRDEADRWAAQWHGTPADRLFTDDVTWWALGHLHGIDLQDQDGRFLHDDEQVAQWLEEFRHRCQISPAPDEV
ncbi:hypothetical protein AB0F81_15610 [Actinoplanes sp. NPDC024001]|uniref:hypothetical protein n=1 Tax=Actinoplanes sp. NPDC024001 TaxID=3154598 RepID=UPI0033F1C342